MFVNLVYAIRPDGTTFYEPDRTPSFTPPPGSGTLQLAAIVGVDNYVVPRLVGVGGSSPGGYWASSDFRAAYLGTGSLCSSLTGAGQQIGIAAPGVGYTLAKNASTPGDIETYENATRLTGVPQVVPRLVNSLLPIVPDGSRGCVEAALDIEMAIAMAPGATVIPFQGPYMSDVLSAMATTPNLNQGSSSFTGGDTQGGINTSQQFISEMAAQGQSFFQGSGDGGAYQTGTQNCSCACMGGSGTQTLLSCPGSCQTLCPASTTTCGSVVDFLTPTVLGSGDMRTLTNLTLVGGTQLSLNGSTYSETTWNGSGGGVITNVPLPTYQTNLPGIVGSSRNSPDVALVAASIYMVATGCFDGPNGGVTIGNPLPCPSGQLAPAQATPVGGTSASSPLWAGFTALINQQGATNGPVGFLNPLLYQMGRNALASFNNIDDDSTNTNQCNFGYTAATHGYNQTTGWGSPTCQLIEQAQVRPQITVGVDDPINGGPVVCMTGTGFTPNGSVTIQYAGIPEQYDSQGNPTTRVAQNNVPVSAGGTINFIDNEQLPYANSISLGVPECTAELQSTGTVSIQVIDNSTGVSATTIVPAALWCEFGPASFGTLSCPSVTVGYHQVGACDGFTVGTDNVNVGSNAAYVIFGIDYVSSADPQTFAFNPADVYVQRGPINEYFVLGDPIYTDILQSEAAAQTTVQPGQNISFQPSGFGAAVVSTLTADGAVQANETRYDLNYGADRSGPVMNFVKGNPNVTSFPLTDDCSSIVLQ